MVENEQQSEDPATNGDTEAAAADGSTTKELRKKKRMKLILYIVLFIIFQIAVITLFDLTVMRVRSPKFRIREATITTLTAGTSALRATMNAEFSVKNANFGPYKYGKTNVEFFYRGAKVGEVLLPESRAKWRSTRKFRADVDLNFVNAQSDLRAGAVPITSSAKMIGRVDLISVLRKDRSANMNCSMEIANDQIRNIKCD